MTAVLFPVGHYNGIRPGPDEESEPSHVIRIGWKQHRLDDDAFAAWVLSHGLPGTGKGQWTEADVVEQAELAGLSDAPEHLEKLVTDGLVIRIPDDPAPATWFAQTYRMDVMFVGLGNAPDRLDGYGVGIPGIGVAAILDPDCYELWQWGSVARTLWDSCQVRATVTAEPSWRPDPEAALVEILGDLRFLLAHGCAYLDVAG
ncbi:hypothetical protein [Kribbella sindirgiensis]|uniref:Uncharacterized protein n=1 Tax=Kribbella sindirgiensis TaxID=1124744 RepID=A0A4R0I701_9ACTN|nr:hypothetical protein [Kribbella sindirgiensis]TCC22340.1 hypothetical protein E0H50_34755 [Kribbella sindirgiensis]